jgi:hypothetical protein
MPVTSSESAPTASLHAERTAQGETWPFYAQKADEEPILDDQTEGAYYAKDPQTG